MGAKLILSALEEVRKCSFSFVRDLRRLRAFKKIITPKSSQKFENVVSFVSTDEARPEISMPILCMDPIN
jgi:hypothetical protein